MELKEAKAFADAAPDVLHEVGNKVEAMHYRAEFSPIDARDENA